MVRYLRSYGPREKEKQKPQAYFSNTICFFEKETEVHFENEHNVQEK